MGKLLKAMEIIRCLHALPSCSLPAGLQEALSTLTASLGPELLRCFNSEPEAPMLAPTEGSLAPLDEAAGHRASGFLKLPH